MKITVVDARAFSAALTEAAAKAESSGAPEFDLLDSLASIDDDARAQLAEAIDAANTTT